jgi:hypothetical protein
MGRMGICILVMLAFVWTVAVWPVCVPLSPDQISGFQPPINERTDTYLWGRIFQKRDGQWCQCKTRIAREFFS